MGERRHEIQVGLVFLLSVAVLIAGVLWFKEFRIGGQFFEVNVEFENTSGLMRGDPVEVRGVSSGSVSAINYTGGRALVTLRLEQSVSLYPDTRFVIENVGIMGQKLVAIYTDAQGEPVPHDSVFHGEFQPGIPGLMADLGGALDSFDRLAVRLEQLLVAFDEADQGTMARILENTDRMTSSMADFFEENRTDLSASVKNLGRAMEDLHIALDGRGEQFGQTLADASRAAARLDTTLVTLETTVERMDRMLARIENGEGTLGKALEDDTLYDEMRTTLTEAKALITDMKENPRKYLKFSVF